MEQHHEAMLAYVKHIFHTCGDITDPKRPFRNKLDHTLRVVKWTERIAREEGGDVDLLTTCAILHDVGYALCREAHPAISAWICDRYLKGHGFDEAYRAAAKKIIAGHGDKARLTVETPLDELILIEADNLEEKGAMDILWDAMEEGAGEEPSYENACQRITARTRKRQKNIMVTATARRFWQERTALMDHFVQCLSFELDRDGE